VHIAASVGYFIEYITMHGIINIKLTAYSCICWLFHRIYYDARNHKHKKME